jgi:hypothetical protein
MMQYLDRRLALSGEFPQPFLTDAPALDRAPFVRRAINSHQ